MSLRTSSLRSFFEPRGSPAALVAGPALFVGLLVAPLDVGWKVQGAVGLVSWILVWLVTQCVRIEVPFLLPVVVTAAVPLAPWWSVVSVYWDPLVLFIVGAVGIVMGWKYWGFTERVAIRSLLVVGHGRKRQVLVWFGLSVGFSAVIPDTVVAAMLVPIAATVLDHQGYPSRAERTTEKYPTVVLLALGWGAAVGGSATPLGGGMDILTIELLSEYAGRPVPFHRWIYHLLPFTALNALVVGGYLYVVFDVQDEGDSENGGEEPTNERLYRRKLDRLGDLGRNEVVVVAGWLLAFAVVFLEPFYASTLAGPLARVEPLLVFPLVFVALFAVPAAGEGTGRVLNSEAMRAFPLPVLLVWPGAIALARILVESGTVDVLGGLLGQYLVVGLVGVVAVSVVTVLTTNLTTNTAAAAALVPLVIGITAAAGLPVAGFVYVVAGMVNVSYALPSSNGCLAVTTGFGANVSTLLRHGAVLCVLNAAVGIGYFFLAMEFLPGWTLP